MGDLQINKATLASVFKTLFVTPNAVINFTDQRHNVDQSSSNGQLIWAADYAVLSNEYTFTLCQIS